jgi:hypothetical protein
VDKVDFANKTLNKQETAKVFKQKEQAKVKKD